MKLEQGLYSQVVNLRWNYSKLIAENKNKNEAKFKLQGQSARSQCWFDFDFDWIEVSFSKCETDFNRKFFHIHDYTQDKNTFKIFQVPIRNSKYVEIFKFHNDAPMLMYCQKLLNRCCFISLASEFSSIE